MQGPREGGAGEAIGEINVIPFIDICLVLLIIVLMTAAAESKYEEVRLPAARSVAYRDMNLALTLSVRKDGSFTFEEEEKAIEPRNLWTALRTIQGGEPWSMLVIRADREAPYGSLALALQCAQSLGVGDISLAVKDDRAGGTSGP
jgi:biopolymer transport protein ExbD